MIDRFDQLTKRAKKVLALAQEEAQRHNHSYIGTEHLFLGLVQEGEGIAAVVLNNLGVDLSEVHSTVEFIVGRSDRMVVSDVNFTPRAKKAIELAVEEAGRLNHDYIGTGHLLIGLVRDGEGVAAGILEGHGVDLEMVRTQVIKVVNHNGGSKRSESQQHTKTPTVEQNEVRNSLVLFALTLLVIEGIFGAVVVTSRLTNDQQFYALLMMTGLFVVFAVTGAIMMIRRPANLYEAVEEQARRQEEIQARVRQVLEVMNDPVFARAIARAVAAETTKGREVERPQQPGTESQSEG